MMTFTDVLQDSTDFMEKSPEEAMCDVVRTSITEAARTGRLTHGISKCVTELQRDPKDVVICILPLDTSHCDVNLNIQLLLIESVCMEYGILVLKMDVSQLDSGLAFTASKAELVLDSVPLDNAASKQPIKTALLTACPALASELFCCLIQHGEEGPSFSDKKLLRTFQDLSEEEDYAYSLDNSPTSGMGKTRSSDSSSSNSSLSLESSEEFPPE